MHRHRDATVSAYLRRASAAGLAWPLPAALDDGALETRLMPLVATLRGMRGHGSGGDNTARVLECG